MPRIKAPLIVNLDSVKQGLTTRDSPSESLQRDTDQSPKIDREIVNPSELSQF